MKKLFNIKLGVNFHKLSTVIVFCFCYFQIFAQETKGSFKASSKKVGLVLSGGGAKGYAHIGVLKVIDRLGLHLDYIAGTSAGALIGSLYAAGYSALELEKLVYETNFIDILFMEKKRTSLSFFDKKYRDRYLAEFSFDEFKLHLPSGLSQGQGMNGLLSSLFFSVRHVSDYSKLSIPFFCTATDLETGKLSLMKKGDLVQSVLASAAFPSLIAPVEIDGRLYVDGGVSVNMPVKELKNHGLDFVIAVDVMRDPYKKHEINSILKIIEQISSYGHLLDNIEQRKAADILIAPDVKKYSIMDFAEKQKIIDEGEKAALQFITSLSGLPKKKKVDKEEVDFPSLQNDLVFITNISVNGLDHYDPSYVLSKMNIQPYRKTTHQKLRKGMEGLYATGNFLNATYKLTPDGSGDHLTINIRENPSKLLFKVGANYSQPFKTGILLNLTLKQLFLKNSFLSTDMVLGDNPRGTFNYYVDNGWRLGWGYYFNYDQFDSLSPDTLAHSKTHNYYKNHDITQRFYLQSILKDKYLFSAGLEHRILMKKLGYDKDLKWRGVLQSMYASLQADNLDNLNFPHNGFTFDGTLKYSLLNHSIDFSDKLAGRTIQRKFKNILSLEAMIQMNFPLDKSWTLRLRSSLGLQSPFDKEPGHFNESKSFYGVQNYLGGVNQRHIFNNEHFYGYPFAYLYGTNKFLVGAELQYEFIKNHYIGFLSNLANLEDKIADFKLLRYKYRGFAVSYGHDSILGPLRLFWMYSPTKEYKGRHSVRMALGFWF